MNSGKRCSANDSSGYLYFIPTVRLSHLWAWNIYTQWTVSGGTETNWSGVPVKSKRCGIGRLRCGGRQNVSNGFLRMDPEGDVSWKPTSSSKSTYFGAEDIRIVQLAILISLLSLLLHEDNAGSRLSTSPRAKRTSHLIRPHLLLSRQIIYPRFQFVTGAWLVPQLVSYFNPSSPTTIRLIY